MNNKHECLLTCVWLCFFQWGWQTLARHVTILLDCHGPRCTQWSHTSCPRFSLLWTQSPPWWPHLVPRPKVHPKIRTSKLTCPVLTSPLSSGRIYPITYSTALLGHPITVLCYSVRRWILDVSQIPSFSVFPSSHINGSSTLPLAQAKSLKLSFISLLFSGAPCVLQSPLCNVCGIGPPQHPMPPRWAHNCRLWPGLPRQSPKPVSLLPPRPLIQTLFIQHPE